MTKIDKLPTYCVRTGESKLYKKVTKVLPYDENKALFEAPLGTNVR